MKTHPYITVITDCADDNARGRVETRLHVLFGFPVSFIGVRNDLEAAGNLVDVLDASYGREGIVLMNVAPRGGAARRHENGSPFSYFFHEKTLVVGTADGYTFSLAKKLGILRSTLPVIDIHASLQELYRSGAIDKREFDSIGLSQFRSLHFLPHAALVLHAEGKIPVAKGEHAVTPDVPPAVWWIDNFGNCKTTLMRSEVSLDAHGRVELSFGVLPYIEHLKDVPDGEGALIRGSSGTTHERLLEIVVQGKSAEARYNLFSGTAVL